MSNAEPPKVTLTEDMISRLRAERYRTSVGPKALLKPYTELPKGLNHPMITHWLGGRIKTAREDHLEFVLDAWSCLSDIETIELTDELLAELQALQKASGISPEMMVRWGDAGTIGLSVSNIKNYLSGNAKSIPLNYLDAIRNAFSLNS
jgi:hypothetical protein